VRQEQRKSPHSAAATEKEIKISRAGRISKAWNKGLGLALILLIAGALRLQHIRADPPLLLPSISGSAGIYFDEGIYCHNARNKVLFGRWSTDEWNPLVYNAPLTLVYYLGFRLFGVSIVTVKVINILFGLLGILLFHVGLRAYLRPGQAMAVTSLFALDYYSVMYSRLGLLENFSSLCFLLGFCLFIRSRGRSSMAFFLGLTAAMAALSKYLFVYFLIAALLAVIVEARRRSDVKFLFSFLAGGLALGLPWLFGIYLPFRSAFAKIGSGWGMLSLPHSVSQAWGNLVHQPLPRYLALLPAVAFLLVLFIGWLLLKLLRPKPGKGQEPDLFIFLWIAGTVFSMGLLNYRPLRYYLPLIPALYLAVSVMLRNRDTIVAEKNRFWPLVIIPALLFLPFFRNLAFGPSGFFVFPLGLRCLGYISLAGVVLLFLTKRPKWKTPLEVLVLVIMLGSSLFLYQRHFYQDPTYNLEAASQYLRTLPPGSVVMGQEAPRLTLETPFKALMAYENWFNDQDPFVRYKPTHLLVLNRFGGAELGWIKRRFPETARHLVEVREFPVWDTTVTLYRVPAQGQVLETPFPVTDQWGNPREYRLFWPGQSETSFPLLVYFHGVISPEFKSIRSLKNYTGSPVEETGLIPFCRDRGIALLVPEAKYEYTFLGRRSTGWLTEKEVDGVEKIIDTVVERYPVDRSRICLAGMSAGAVLSHYLANRRPRFYSAILSHSQAYVSPQGIVLRPAEKGPRFGVVFCYNIGDYKNLIAFCEESESIYREDGYRTALLRDLPPRGHAWSSPNNERFWELLQSLGQKR